MKRTWMILPAMAAMLVACGDDPASTDSDNANTDTTATVVDDNQATSAAPALEGDIITTPGGVQYTINEAGTGVELQQGDIVMIHYKGMLADGTVFDASYDRGAPIVTKVGMRWVIPGWDETLLQLRVGDKATLHIPSNMGYGANGTPDGSIPPNSDLIFEVEVMHQANSPFDITGIEPIVTESGLEIYKTHVVPSGKLAQNGDLAGMHYTGFFENGEKFDSSFDNPQNPTRPYTFNIGSGQVIKGWEEAAMHIRVGEAARVIIPGDLAYGEQGRGPIGPNATLHFDMINAMVYTQAELEEMQRQRAQGN